MKLQVSGDATAAATVSTLRPIKPRRETSDRGANWACIIRSIFAYGDQRPVSVADVLRSISAHLKLIKEAWQDFAAGALR